MKLNEETSLRLQTMLHEWSPVKEDLSQRMCSPHFLGAGGYSMTLLLPLASDCESLRGRAMLSTSSLLPVMTLYPLRATCGQYTLSMLVFKKNLLTVLENDCDSVINTKPAELLRYRTKE